MEPVSRYRETRQHLLDLLAEIDEAAAADSYMACPRVAEVVVWYLGECCERRAVETLQRLADEVLGELSTLANAVLKRIKEGEA